MFEHVGVDFYETFFKRCAELLTDDGVMLLHSIGRSTGPDVTSPWITKYIFPGGYIPALSEVFPAIERSGLLVCDTEILRLHYAETLKAWRERFMAHREEAAQLYDERFVRMWQFYLAAAEMSFRKQNLMNLQIQLTKRQGVVPMTRDYIAREEARLRAMERGGRPRLRMCRAGNVKASGADRKRRKDRTPAGPAGRGPSPAPADLRDGAGCRDERFAPWFRSGATAIAVRPSPTAMSANLGPFACSCPRNHQPLNQTLVPVKMPERNSGECERPHRTPGFPCPKTCAWPHSNQRSICRTTFEPITP